MFVCWNGGIVGVPIVLPSMIRYFLYSCARGSQHDGALLGWNMISIVVFVVVVVVLAL